MAYSVISKLNLAQANVLNAFES